LKLFFQLFFVNFFVNFFCQIFLSTFFVKFFCQLFLSTFLSTLFFNFIFQLYFFQPFFSPLFPTFLLPLSTFFIFKIFLELFYPTTDANEIDNDMDFELFLINQLDSWIFFGLNRSCLKLSSGCIILFSSKIINGRYYTVQIVWELQHRRIRDLGLAVNYHFFYPYPFGL